MDPTRFRQLTCDLLGVNHGTLDNLNLEQFCPLDHGKHHADSPADLRGLGRLITLPFEILSTIFSQLDIRSLFTCCRLNRRAMYLMDSLQEYRDIIHFVPNAIRGALSIESSSYLTSTIFHTAIFDGKCVGEVIDFHGSTDEEHCGDPAQFMCILTGRRWCLRHMSILRREDRYLPLLVDEVEDVFGLPTQEITDIPAFKSLPGRYTPDLHHCEDRHYFLDGPSVRTRALLFHGSERALSAFQSRRLLEGFLSNRVLLPTEYQFKFPTPDYIIENFACGQSPPPLFWNLGRLRIRRFMAVVRSPSLHHLDRIPRWGRYCLSCQEKDFMCWFTFTVEAFQEHLLDHERCPYLFPRKKPLEYSDTYKEQFQLNSQWPHVERHLVCKPSKSVPRFKELWTHEEILARWNSRSFRQG